MLFSAYSEFLRLRWSPHFVSIDGYKLSETPGATHEDKRPRNGKTFISQMPDEVAEYAGGDEGGQQLENADGVKWQ